MLRNRLADRADLNRCILCSRRRTTWCEFSARLCWVLKFGPAIARRLRRCRRRPSNRWHLDEMVVRIAGERMYLWRAVDHEGEVLDILVQRRRDSLAALRLMRKLLKKQGFAPRLLVTDKLRSYASAFQRLRLTCPHEQGLRQNTSHVRCRASCEANECAGKHEMKCTGCTCILRHKNRH